MDCIFDGNVYCFSANNRRSFKNDNSWIFTIFNTILNILVVLK